MSNNDEQLKSAGDAGQNESPQSDSGASASNPGPSPADPSEPGDIASEEELQELFRKAAKADENWDKYVRLTADFDNFKKRAARERTEAVKYANESLVEKLLPVLDNFEAALAAANNTSGSNLESLKTGIGMIHTQLKSLLTESGLEEVDASGKPFDPNLHEAVSQQPSTDVEEGHVLQQMRKGYKLRDRLVRPAMVVVAKRP